ncbi:GNAT family N-acetyltransferase [Micromonospora sp. NPDC049081]|uniref:GNAT family N-acetyltransferase n=1 Tax=Micromonospora sp. NPDC049081 TaxID=3155150 RepID=UPI00340E3D8E
MPELIAPAVQLYDAWREAHAEWGPGWHEDGFGLRPGDEVDSSSGFAAWVARLTPPPGPSGSPDPGDDRGTYRWIVEDQRVLGAIALRHDRDEHARWAGHLGFGIRPSARRRGLASWALGRMLDEARALGRERLLVVCATGNVASARTIERCGGVFEGVGETRLGSTRRYRFTLRG